MEEIIMYAQLHWVEWIFAAISIVLGMLYRSINRRLKEEQKKSTAVSEGMQAILRDSIINNYNKCIDRGYCPIYAKESAKKIYHAYHNLGGNDVATSLYKKMLDMPEEREE